MKLIDILVEELPKRGGWPDGAVECYWHRGFDVAHFYDSLRNEVPNPIYIRGASLCGGDGCGVVITSEQYESALAAKNGGWIEWAGGKCPVEEGTLVDVRYRDSEYYHDSLGVYALSSFGVGADYWVRDGLSNDIIAYRLHKPQEAEQAKSELNDCIEQDAAPVWNGEGLPPAGCKCEYLDRNNGWYPVTIKYASNQIVVICGMTNILGDKQETEIAKDVQLDKPQFRPLLTESERKRKEAIEEMIKIATIYTTKSLSLDLALNSIYNAIAAGEITGMKLEN